MMEVDRGGWEGWGNKETGLSWVRRGQRHGDTTCQREERRSEEERGGVAKKRAGSRGFYVGGCLTSTPLLPFSKKPYVSESHFISLRTSSPGVVHASVPCPHSTVCFFCCLCGDVGGEERDSRCRCVSVYVL